jgi:hypothetical protein
MTDASDTAVAISLFVVYRSDAADVLESDLKSPAMSQLVGIRYKKLNAGQCKWNTFEVELYGIVRVVCIYGGLITAATAPYPPGEGNPSKIGFWCDSTTAIGQMPSLTLPVGTVDHLSAKARRFYSWSDKVAGTKHWSYILKHFPGDSISLPHMMTHMGDMCLQRRDEMRSAQAAFIVFPMTLSAQPPPLVMMSPAVTDYPPPAGFLVNHLALSEEDCVAISESYSSDTAPVLSIPLSDIYAVATKSRPIPKLHMARITPWINVRFFAIVPPGCSIPLLYTPTSLQAVEVETEDAMVCDPSSSLVLVVPAGAQVRITDYERQPSVTTADDHPTYGKWMQHDLRRDLLHLVHTNNDHPSLAHSLRALRQLCWFPSIVPYTKYHIGACPICITKLRPQRAIGSSVVAAQRLWVIYVDHYVLKGDLPALSHVSHVLTLLCSRTRFTMFIVVNSDSAKDTAMAIHNRWYPFMGIPVVFKSDRGPGFASKCMAAFRQMMGVKQWTFSAADDPTQHSLLEHKHKLLTEVLHAAEIKGDIKSRADLEFYVASANSRQNLHASSSEAVSPFESITGQPPRVISDMVKSETLPTATAKVDQQFLSTLRARIDEEFLWAS